MNYASPHALYRRFRYMFPLEGEGRRRAYVFFREWLTPLAKACEDVDKLLAADMKRAARVKGPRPGLRTGRDRWRALPGPLAVTI